MASTKNDMGDPSQVTPLLDQVDVEIGSVTFDGAYDGAPTYDAVATRADDIPVIMPPHVTRSGERAKPGEMTRGNIQRNSFQLVM